MSGETDVSIRRMVEKQTVAFVETEIKHVSVVLKSGVKNIGRPMSVAEIRKIMF